MLINVDMELCELENTPPDEVSYLFNEIARASWHRWHRIVMESDLSNWVAKQVPMPREFIPRIEWIGNKFPFVREQVSNSPVSLTIELDAEKKIEKVKNQFRWVVGHKHFSKCKMRLDRINLLVENEINDGGMLDLILRAEANKVGVGELDIKPYNGGGDPILDIFKNKLTKEKKEMTICIADRDYLVFKRNVSKELNEIYLENVKDDFIGGLEILPCNTIENFFPLSLIKFIVTNGKLHVVEKLEGLFDKVGKSCAGEKFVLCHNIKDGLKVESVIKQLNSSNLSTSSIGRIKKLLRSVYSIKESEFKNFKFEGCGRVVNNILKKDSAKAKEAKEIFKDIIKSDCEWERNFGNFLYPIVWFLCCDETYNYEASTHE